MTEILGADPPALGACVPEVGAEIEAIVARTLSKRADDRFETTDALVAALERALHVEAFGAESARGPSVSPVAHTISEAEIAVARTPKRGSSMRRRIGVGGAIGLAIALTFTAVLGRWRARQSPADARLSIVAPGRRKVVAVLGVPGGETDARAAALPELLATELAMGDQIRVVPHDVVARVVGDRELVAPTLAKLYAVANVDDVIVARPSVTKSGDVRLELRLSAVTTSDAAGENTELAVDGTLWGASSSISSVVRRRLSSASALESLEFSIN